MEYGRPGAPVVVGIDGSVSALAATRWAAQEAARRRTGLQLLSAVGWRAPGRISSSGLGADYREVMLQSTRAELAEAAAAAGRIAPDIEICRTIIEGYPVPQLTAASRDAQLVVIGTSGGAVPGARAAGSVAVGLATRALCPVVVVRDAVPPPDLPVVVGIDGSPVSEPALAFAFEEASARRVPLVAVHSWSDQALDASVWALLDWEAIENTEHQVLAERLAGWGTKYPDVEVRRVVSRDRPARALVEQAAHAQLLVVGSHGRGGVAGLLLGSVSHAALHRAPCPVAVVRPDPVDAPEV